jgi:hypothetical protein
LKAIIIAARCRLGFTKKITEIGNNYWWESWVEDISVPPSCTEMKSMQKAQRLSFRRSIWYWNISFYAYYYFSKFHLQNYYWFQIQKS